MKALALLILLVAATGCQLLGFRVCRQIYVGDSNTPVVCETSGCGSTMFEERSGNKWRCVACGAMYQGGDRAAFTAPLPGDACDRCVCDQCLTEVLAEHPAAVRREVWERTEVEMQRYRDEKTWGEFADTRTESQ